MNEQEQNLNQILDEMTDEARAYVEKHKAEFVKKAKKEAALNPF